MAELTVRAVDEELPNDTANAEGAVVVKERPGVDGFVLEVGAICWRD
eukprot:CAMPEP_0174906724 /NCGR_PEP_ID=MMETSP0167-20121228/58144_1 /TAXON_ID=38298 /ORGANISM="Rhodella maculata, Strain CCMP736" /LENGTH=46 /DNA_ID= /DNA_START= /DNA_END= /DNA_ORIENTATION=